MSKSKGRRTGTFLLMILSCIAILLFVSSRKQSQWTDYWYIGLMVSVSLNFLVLSVIYRLLYHLGRYKEKYEKMQRKIADIETVGDSTGSIGGGKNLCDENSKDVTAEIAVIHQNDGGGTPILPVAEPNSTDSVVKSDSGALGTPCTGKLVVKDFLTTLVEEYNKARTDWTLQSQFLDTYRHAWFYVENSMARRQSSNTTPLFITYDNGFYMAVATKDQQEMYYVFPRFGVSYSESVHGPGAMGKVFRACNYSHDESYDTIEVIEPAVFIRKDARAWSFEKSGSIKLML